ncbi:hypothetical protein RFI_30858 [Reticulomyxa filosa]|uniref:Uncharacterized protein n=1 Tax=Reticulomyxa filosa TaxID=46433 RepID=X6LY44_RETFI|nr:hypothetical protein RFI_30858 [Reticulomyxa filosa]|eukprot:ETO06534.1 hypothetical protein RFI_30858 [Reticulomyxa filosa]
MTMMTTMNNDNDNDDDDMDAGKKKKQSKNSDTDKRGAHVGERDIRGFLDENNEHRSYHSRHTHQHNTTHDMKREEDDDHEPQDTTANTEFDVTKNYDSTYIINFLKTQFTLIVPPHLRKSLRIYITCAIGMSLSFFPLFFAILYNTTP